LRREAPQRIVATCVPGASAESEDREIADGVRDQDVVAAAHRPPPQIVRRPTMMTRPVAATSVSVAMIGRS
jgi:hypothetical protein